MKFRMSKAKSAKPKKPYEPKVLTKLEVFKIKYNKFLVRAELKGTTEFLTFEEFSNYLCQSCFYCGEQSTGLDRVDSSKGYNPDNIVSCCGTCNMMKFNYNQNFFLSHIEKIHKHLISKVE